MCAKGSPLSLMIIGIDHGNSQIKTVHTIFTSGINEHGTVKPPLPSDILCYEGKYYSISSTREAYDRKKTEDEKNFIMTLFAIAKEILASNQYKASATVHLAVGLPPEHFSRQKQEFAEYFTNRKKTWEFTYSDAKTAQDYEFKIKLGEVFVFPQAFSAIATRPSVLKNYSASYVIDIGGYTVDTLLLSNGKPDLQKCFSFELGIITMNAAIAHRVNSEFGIKIEENHITDVLLNNPTILNDDVQSLIREQADKHTQKILRTLRENGIELKASPAVFIGGGSMILKDLINESSLVAKNYTEFIEDISANAIGYEALANTALRKAKA